MARPDPVIRGAMAKERPMPAVVLDHEETHQEARRWYGYEEAQPIAEPQCCPRQEPEHDEGARSDQ